MEFITFVDNLEVKRKEKMYFIKDNAFFLNSSPGQIAEFIYLNGLVNGLVLREGDKIILTAKKHIKN